MNIVNDLVSWYETQKLESTIEIVVAIVVIMVSIILSSFLSYGVIKIFNWKEVKKKIKKNAFYKPLKMFFILIGIYISVLILKLPDSSMQVINKILKVAVICLIAKGISNIANYDSILFMQLRKSDRFENNANVLKIISKVVKVVVYTITAFVILAEFGYNLNGIVAGLGLGSVVIALAAQDIAKNLFAGASIFMDRPFMIGDFIDVKGYQGKVEDIKFRSTKIRLLDNSLLTLPNEVLVTEAIDNWTNIKKRRMDLNLELMLNTKLEKVEQISKILKQELENTEGVISDSVEVHFDKITANGMNLFIYMYTDNVQYTEFLKFKEKINLQIMKLLENNQISLAYPSYDIYVRK